MQTRDFQTLVTRILNHETGQIYVPQQVTFCLVLFGGKTPFSKSCSFSNAYRMPINSSKREKNSKQAQTIDNCEILYVDKHVQALQSIVQARF